MSCSTSHLAAARIALRLGLALSAAGLALRAAHASAPATPPAPWRPFSADSPWNQRIAADAPSDPDSRALIDDFASRGPLHINIQDWSIPVYFVDAAHTPKHAVHDLRPGVFGRGFEFPRAIPIPDGAVASPPVGEHSDNHLSIIDRTLQLEWGMWAARKNDRGEWGTGLGAVTDLAGNGVAEPWFAAAREFDAHRARAGGFPLVAGLIFVDEIKAGRIEHALCFAYDHCRGGFFVPPASTAQVTMQEMTNRTGIPMGGRIQLDPAWDVEGSPLSRSGRIIARALQEYGAYCGDFAGANVLYAENAPAAVAAWQGLLANDELRAVFTPEFIRAHFRVLDMGNVLPGQNCEVPPPYVVDVRIRGVTATTRIDYFTHTVRIAVPPATDVTNLAAEFSCFPRDCRLTLHGEPSPGASSTFDGSRPVTARLTTRNGETNEWSIVVTPLH
jgi:hypothetical protein